MSQQHQRRPVMPASYDLFSTPQNVYAPVCAETLEIAPVNFQSNTGQVLFQFQSGDSSFLRPQWKLTGSFHLESGTTTTSTRLTGQQRCSLIDNAVFTNFRNASLSWNDTVCESYNNMWGHYADFMINYSYKESAKRTYVRQLCLSHQDNVGQYDSLNADGVKWRREQLEVSKIYEFIMPIPLALCACDRLFPPGSRFQLTLDHASDRVRTLSAADTDEFRVVYDKLALQVERVWLPPPLVKSIYEQWNKRGHMDYRLRRWSCLGPFQLSTNSTLLNVDLGRCRLPLALISFFVDEKAFHGQNTRTCLNYPAIPLNTAVCRWGLRKVPSHDVHYALGGNELTNARAAQLYASFMSLINGGLTSDASYECSWPRFLFNQFFICHEFASEQQTNASSGVGGGTDQEHLTLQFTLTDPVPQEKYLIVFGVTDDGIQLMAANAGVRMSYVPGAL